MVHGLTTAASLWLSAAVGVACGGTLYFAAMFGTAVMLVLLRFGPRMTDDSGDEDAEAEEGTEVDKSLEADLGYGGVEDKKQRRGSETSSLLPGEKRAQSIRKRAHLASLV